MCADSRGYLEQATGPGGCMSSFTLVSADARENRKVIFCLWPAGKTWANDFSHVYCYLATGIAPQFKGRGGKCLCMCEGRWSRHTHTHTHVPREVGCDRIKVKLVCPPINHVDCLGQAGCKQLPWNYFMSYAETSVGPWAIWSHGRGRARVPMPCPLPCVI